MSIFAHRRTPESMKRFYNWFNKYYKNMEKTLDPVIGEAIAEWISSLPDLNKKTALEYACGTGVLTSKIAQLFKSVIAKDQSVGMINVAKQKIEDLGLGLNVAFSEGNLLTIQDKPKSFDYVFMSFALHLFSPEDQFKILERFVSVAKEKVVIIDHAKKWSPLEGFVEWLEGSYYDKFVKMDFNKIAQQLGVKHFSQDNRKRCVVMIFDV